jgi:hypothetical protein
MICDPDKSDKYNHSFKNKINFRHGGKAKLKHLENFLFNINNIEYKH